MGSLSSRSVSSRARSVGPGQVSPKRLQEMGENFDADTDVGRTSEFTRVVAESVAAADEQHGDRADARNDNAIVAGTAGKAEARAGDGGE